MQYKFDLKWLWIWLFRPDPTFIEIRVRIRPKHPDPARFGSITLLLNVRQYSGWFSDCKSLFRIPFDCIDVNFVLLFLSFLSHYQKICTNVFLQYYVFHILQQIYTINNATFPIQMYAITVQICGNFWGIKYIKIVYFFLAHLSSLSNSSKLLKSGIFFIPLFYCLDSFLILYLFIRYSYLI